MRCAHVTMNRDARPHYDSQPRADFIMGSTKVEHVPDCFGLSETTTTSASVAPRVTLSTTSVYPPDALRSRHNES
jgi:hypothetical protein